MTTNAMAHPWRAPLARSAVCRPARWLIFGLLGWPWLFSVDHPAHRDVSLSAVLALAALAGMAWQAARARTDRRWRAAWDRYARMEDAKRT